MEYNFRKIEQEWQQRWTETGAYTVSNDSAKPKFYVLDMFPYPSGAGLHVGHPLGYIASDIYARYKRLKGFNVLHPMGYDSFGLPAEQYALETGQHPAITTEKNIATFRSQLDKIGFCFDWSREVRTSDPHYYKWTQWIFLQLFKSWYNPTANKAESIDTLISNFETNGNATISGNRKADAFTAAAWKAYTEDQQQEILMGYRLAYSSYGEVNWCEALGTVLANDEVVNGVSERGGHPVIKKKMRQWYLRITAYADRLLEGLERVEFSESLKEQQRNWIGRSQGAEISFQVKAAERKPVTASMAIDDLQQPGQDALITHHSALTVYTTRPDTIFGVDFMVIAPEHELVIQITTVQQQAAVAEYLEYVKSRSDRERMSEVKQITGCFTGAYAINPFDGRQIPIWIAEYVLAGYGTGAIMAVPCGDERDYDFAKHFNIPITNIIGDYYDGTAANPTKDAILTNSGFLNGMVMRDAIDVVITRLVEMGIGKRQINYKMRDAGFSRQRYWGEPFPIIWKGGHPYPLDETDLPLELPHVDKYSAGPEGAGPLANLTDWMNPSLPATAHGVRETSTMPGYAGSSWYFLRYMDPHNDKTFCDRAVSDYWAQVDVYVGGTEHAVGHLLYSRMWSKALFDLGYIGFDEPYKRLVNQGMITGVSALANVVGFYFGENLMANLDENQKEKISILKSKYKDPQKINICVSEDLMKYARIIYRNPTTFEEKEHTDFRNRLYNILLKPVSSDIEFLELKNIITIGPSDLHYKIHIPIEYVNYKDELDFERLKQENPLFYETEFIIMNDEAPFICTREVEKMSKSKFNTVNPTDLVEKFGADTFRMYEMFLGPVEASKPWDTKGIEGVHRFLKKLWRLFYDDVKGKVWTAEQPAAAELKILHRTIKKIEDDTKRFSFNTAVSSFMICVNDLTDIKCHKKGVLEQVLVLLTPYAPHIAEELWHLLGNADSVLDAAYPVFNVAHVTESSKEYPVSVNGRVRTNISIALDITQPEVEEIILANETVQKWLEGKPPKKIIYVKNKMVNVVV